MNLTYFVSFVALASFAACSLATTVNFEGVQVRKSLLDALKRFHLGQDPLVTTEPVLEYRSTSSTEMFTGFPIDILSSIIEVLDLDSLIKFNQVCSTYRFASKYHVNRKLFQVSPHFITDDFRLNALIYRLLVENYSESKNIRDAEFKDELELFTLKFFFEPATFSTYPTMMLQYILCFFHEIVYGITYMAPSNLKDSKIKFIQKLRKFDLPRSLAYLMNSEHPELAVGVTLNDWKQMLVVINTKPSTEAMIALYTAPDGHFSRSNQTIPAEFLVARSEILASHLPVAELGYFIRYNAGQNAFSQEMFDRFMLSGPNIIEYIQSGYVTRDSRYELAIAEALVMACSSATSGLLSQENVRNIVHESVVFFSCNSIELYDANANNAEYIDAFMTLIARNRNYTLAQLEMFYQVVSSDLLSQENIQSLCTEIIKNNSHLLQHIIENESGKQLIH